MSIDSSDLRDALRPQDGLAAVITLLGLAIAIFLPDSIVKLIGACIAVLGGIAFYMTIRSRINDRISIRRRKTTLPPPSFKTNISTDPKTSATRIRFDDFQETFQFEDEERPKERVSHASAVRLPSPSSEMFSTGSSPQQVASTASLRFDDIERDGRDDHHESGYDDPSIAAPIEGEGFRIVGARAVSPVPSASDGAAVSRAPIPAQPQVSAPANVGAVVGTAQIETERRDALESAPQGEEKGGKRKKKKRGKKHERYAEPASEMESASLGAPSSEVKSSQGTTTAQAASIPLSTGYVESTEEVESAIRSTVPLRGVERPIAEQTAVRRQIQMVLDELSPESEEDPGENEPRAEFVRLVNQVLKAVARSIEGRSIIFFWVNLQRGHFIPEASVTQKGVRLRLGERIPLGNDLISQIARGGVPEIITNISPAAERELAPYYADGTSTSSFVGVPVYFRHEVVGVLAADSSEESNFDEGSVATLAEYTLLISQLIRAYTEKFDLYLMRQSVEAFESLNASLTGASLKPDALADLLLERVAMMFDFLYAAVILYDKEGGEWSIAACRAQSESLYRHLLALRPDMRYSVAGEAARRAEEIYRPQVGSEVRIAVEENLNRGGSFLAVPLMAATKCYGSLVLGHQSADAYVPRDIDLMRDLTRYVAMAIEVVNTNEALEEHLVFDEQTGLYNKAFFMGGFDREVDRARDFKTSLAFALVRVETPTNFAPDRAGEIVHTSVTEVGNLLAKKLRPYDLLGRYGDDIFSIALVGRSDQEAYLWAERLRKEIAGHIIPFGERTFSVTVSAGVCDATSSSDKSQVINGARQALDKAGKDGGNAVVIY